MTRFYTQPLDPDTAPSRFVDQEVRIRMARAARAASTGS